MKLITTKRIGPWELDIEEKRNQKGQVYFCIRGRKRGENSPRYFGSFSTKRAAQMKLQFFDPAEAQGSFRAEELGANQDREKEKHNLKKNTNYPKKG